MARGRAGLTEQELAELTEQLAGGKRPRVQLSGPHFPVEATGTVVRIGSPELDGPDFIRVRVKVNGMTDELAFSPAELRRPGKPAARKSTAARGRTARAGRPAAAGARTAARSDGPAVPTSGVARADAAGAGSPADVDQTDAPADGTPAKTAPPTRTAPPAKAAASRTAAPAKTTAPAPRRAAAPAGPVARRAAAGKGPTVTLTIASAGPAWTLTATRGAKNLAKAVPLPPGVVSAIAELLDQPGLSEAIGDINDVALAEAQARAERLRAELDELEAVLATHRSPSRRR